MKEMFNFSGLRIFTLLLNPFTLFLLLSAPFNSQAQLSEKFDDLKRFEGIYQFENIKELYFQIKAEGSRLRQIRLWDYKEELLDHRSGLEFTNSKTRFQILFSEDASGKVKEALVGGRDHWVKNDQYKPEEPKVLTALETQVLKARLDKVAGALVAAINSGGKIKTFLSEYASESFIKSNATQFTNQSFEIYRLTGGLATYENVSFNQRAAMAEYRSKGKYLDNVYEFNIFLDKEKKIRLFNSRLVSGPAPGNVAKGDKELVKNLQSALNALAEKDLFSGTVLLAKGDKVLFQFACGQVDKQSHQKINFGTRFNLGSMNKMFTALSILQLAEQGKLSLTDPVSKFVDTTWLPTAIADKITIHHLLNHSSGMGDLFTSAYEKASLPNLVSVKELRPFIKVNKLAFEPGKGWAYSNAGMVLLGAVIENVSGLDYFEYIRQNIYKPAGMSRSDVYDIDTERDNLAIGYIPQSSGSFNDNRKDMFTRGNPSGGGYSNLEDLHKFALALISQKLVSAASQQKMFTALQKEYGYGFQVFKYKDHKFIGHAGGAPGINALEYIEPKSGYIVVVLSNYDNTVPGLKDFIMNRIKLNLE